MKSLADRMHDVRIEFPYQFVVGIEESNCPSQTVRSALAKHHADVKHVAINAKEAATETVITPHISILNASEIEN
jgi:hypothetical protein